MTNFLELKLYFSLFRNLITASRSYPKTIVVLQFFENPLTPLTNNISP